MSGRSRSQSGGSQRSIASFFSPVAKPKQGKPDAGAAMPAKAAAASQPAAPRPAAPSPPSSPSLSPSPSPAPSPPPTLEPDAGSGSARLGGELAGAVVRVWWPAESEWYRGRVVAYDPVAGRHRVEYDDGDVEALDLREERWELVSAPAPVPASAAPAAAAKRGRAAAGAGSDDDAGAAEPARARGKRLRRAGGGAVGKARRGAAPAPGLDDASGSEFEPEESDEDSEMDDLEDEDESEGELESDLEDDEDAAPRRRGKGSRAATAKAKARKPGPKAAISPSLGLTPTRTPTKRPAGAGAPASPNPFSGAGFSTPPVKPEPPAARTPRTPPASGRAPSTPTGAGPRTPGDAPPSSALKEALGEGEMDRFSSRADALFPFLKPDRVRDAAGHRPDDLEYDPRTLRIPPGALKAANVSEGQMQWWDFKAHNYDAVLMFKVGKFYELFEMDSHVGVEHLGLTYMKGDRAHAGFPEMAYASMAGGLVRANLKVVVVEQTETPEQLAARNEERKRRGLKRANVVLREKVAVLSRGTLRDPELLEGEPGASWLLSLVEVPAADGSRERAEIGVAAVDAAAGRVLVGQWRDDELRGALRAVLSALDPVEVVLPRGCSVATRRMLDGVLRRPRVVELPPSLPCWRAGEAEASYRAALARAVGDEAAGGDLPELAALAGRDAARSAFGGALEVLRDALIDAAVVSSRRVERLEDAFGVGAWDGDGGGATGAPEGAAGDAAAPGAAEPAASALPSMAPYCVLDGAALDNLEVVTSSEGGPSAAGTLLASLDRCGTAPGRARLRSWLCRPLLRIPDIVARQDAVAELMGALEGPAARSRASLASSGNLERGIARLVAAGAGVGSARDAPHVVLYEDVAAKRVRAVATVLRGLAAVRRGLATLRDARPTSPLLRSLCAPGEPGSRLLDLEGPLDAMFAAADWDDASKTGSVVPAPGVDEAFDVAEAARARADAAIAAYAKEMRSKVPSLRLISLQREAHVIEVSDGARVPQDWMPRPGKKGVKRYVSPELQRLAEARDDADQTRQEALSGILQRLIRKFASYARTWTAAADCAAELDALMGLAIAASCADGPMVRPEFVEPAGGDAAAAFEARELRHPASVPGAGGTFVPNDVSMGGPGHAPFVVLTGPNMGGKSTLMRQICLAAVAAQVGAWVPARSLRLTPVDAVFVRTGARDRLVAGQSTFFIEMAETAAALRRATAQSLVVLDELGRGTSTSDGSAIADAVLRFLSKRVRCRGLFATHYHSIAAAHESDPDVALMHMACRVGGEGARGGAPGEGGDEGADVPEVVFLYRLASGACPKSYGPNVARLAGLPKSVVQRATAISRRVERGLPALSVTTAVEHAVRRAVAAVEANDRRELAQLEECAKQLALRC